ncbi:phage tail tape measure C-terminal domain-containing protein [Henriciella litoralis]|uniref:phage tail tape measure C-terminal domain-containing protein n=1 Tax=Henriciella litoralis TaxID=568102 RepID=UPI000A06C7A0|nr:phage tail tape measure C-terminal domain-containing protein [Henriciella litoralis]
MDEFQDSLTRAGDAVSALVEGPGAVAARSLEQAFARAGDGIEAALSRAARSGELDFAQMAQSVIADLARIAAEAALARAGIGQASQAFTVNINGSGSGAGSLPVGARGDISKAVAKAAAMGGRYR